MADRCGITTQTFTFGRSDVQNFLRAGDGKSISASSTLRLSEKHPLCRCCSQVSSQSPADASTISSTFVSSFIKGLIEIHVTSIRQRPLHTLPSEDVLASTSRRNPVTTTSCPLSADAVKEGPHSACLPLHLNS